MFERSVLNQTYDQKAPIKMTVRGVKHEQADPPNSETALTVYGKDALVKFFEREIANEQRMRSPQQRMRSPQQRQRKPDGHGAHSTLESNTSKRISELVKMLEKQKIDIAALEQQIKDDKHAWEKQKKASSDCYYRCDQL